MRILIVGANYAPEETGIAPYTTGLAEHLAKRGHSVIALTGFPCYPARRVRDGHRGLLWKRETRRGVDVHRRWQYVPATQSAVGRGAAEGSFLLSGLTAAALPRPDVLLGVVPSLSGGLLARILSGRFRVPYGLILQDLMARAAEQGGVSGSKRVARLVRCAESWAARGAAAVGIVAEGFRPYLESLGVDPRRIQRVRNWTHTTPPTMDRATVRDRLGFPQDAVVCLHAGNMGFKQGLDNVVECARLAADSDRKLLFVLMGDGNQRPYLEALLSRYALPTLRLLPLQPAVFFSSVLAAADLLLVNQRASVVDMSLPSKLASYFAAGRPVVAAVDAASEAAREIDASAGGEIVAPSEPRALLIAVRSLARDTERCVRMGEAARAWAGRVLDRDHAMERYEVLLTSIVRRGRSRRAREHVRQQVAA